MAVASHAATVGFDLRRPSVIQTAFVVEDMGEAVHLWTEKFGIGPFFQIEHWTGDGPLYRGEASRAKATIALAVAGQMQIELIQPEDNEPSVYREVIETRGYGFHHCGMASTDVEADIVRLKNEGYELAFEARTPAGRMAYLADRSGKRCILELIDISPAAEWLFSAVANASVGWAGQQPLRSIRALGEDDRPH